MWSFTNLLEVRVALWLREQVSLQLLGKIVPALRKRGFDAPLAQLRVGVVEHRNHQKRVIIQNPDGAWEEPLSGQLILEIVLPLGQFRVELEAAAERDRKRQRRPGQIERKRGRLGSEPVFAGTRSPWRP